MLEFPLSWLEILWECKKFLNFRKICDVFLKGEFSIFTRLMQLTTRIGRKFWSLRFGLGRFFPSLTKFRQPTLLDCFFNELVRFSTF
ncbi:MAG: hypothetical protein BGP22_13950 [Variovorax sp. 67-131]|nr:MAG: hypothetical protein ABS94_04385 [Variovorax sp. SCN 67-85]OJZ05113.1 MAG: hypothetical protein BGP22_13950 [Variovorax sp. 67-131]